MGGLSSLGVQLSSPTNRKMGSCVSPNRFEEENPRSNGGNLSKLSTDSGYQTSGSITLHSAPIVGKQFTFNLSPCPTATTSSRPTSPGPFTSVLKQAENQSKTD